MCCILVTTVFWKVLKSGHPFFLNPPSPYVHFHPLPWNPPPPLRVDLLCTQSLKDYLDNIAALEKSLNDDVIVLAFIIVELRIWGVLLFSPSGPPGILWFPSSFFSLYSGVTASSEWPKDISRNIAAILWNFLSSFSRGLHGPYRKIWLKNIMIMPFV